MQADPTPSIEERLTSAKLSEEGVNVVWEPIPGTSQELAVDTRCHHTLYHGARGPGKTITQLMRFRKRVGMGYGSFWRGIIFDREFKNLADLVAQSKRFFPQFGDGAKFLHGASEYKWVWPTGEELLFRHAKKPADYDNFHGHEYPFIGWNELTKYPTGELYDKMMSTNRSSFSPKRDTPKRMGHNGDPPLDDLYDTPDGQPLPPIPLEVFATTNPNGPGHNWVKLRFITPAKNGEVVKKSVPVFNPQTQQDDVVVRTQVAIFGSYRENIYLPPEYVAELEQIKDPNLRAAWLFGSWDVNAGGAFDDIWSANTHILQRFPVPEGWHVDRAFDWGSSHPFSVGWFCESNGEEVVMPDGTTRAFPRGTLIQFAEWYGCQKDPLTRQPAYGTNKGLKLSAPDIAEGIRDREIALLEKGWVSTQPRPGPADNQIRDVREADVDTIEKKMGDKGVRWERSDKSKGSRKNGFQLLRDRLEAAIRGEGPGIYFMSNCVASTTLIPSLPRDEDEPDDVDTDAEDHGYDMVRYRVLKSSNRAAKALKVKHAT